MSFAKRFIGAENLPTRLSEFDVQQSFCMSADDIAAVSGRFRHDRRVAAAIQMLFLRASGRPMDRFASVPKTLLRAVCEAFQTPAVSIASLRSLYARRQTLYEHQAWARTYLGLLDLDAAGVDQLQKVLAISALEAAQTLHRIEEAFAIADFKAHGLEFAGSIPALRNADDNRTLGVMNPAIRGQTDRFVHIYRKP